MKSNILVMTALCSALLVSGCASITGSKNQPISVNAYNEGDAIDGVKCTLMNDKGSWYVTTPGSVMIQKSYSDMTATCQKKNLKPGSMTVVSSANGGVWGNILAGGIIGYAVDASSGAGFNYPTNINVEMGKNTTLAPIKPAGNSGSQPANKVVSRQ